MFHVQSAIVCFQAESQLPYDTIITYDFPLDTENIYTLATQQIVSQYGKNYTWELKQRVMGYIGRDVAMAIVEALELPITPEEYIQSVQEVLAEMFPKSNLLQGQITFNPIPLSTGS